MKKSLIATLALSSTALFGAELSPFEPKVIPDGYFVETIPTPVDEAGEPLLFGIGGIGFLEDGTAMVASRNQGIWKYKEGRWLRFSDHLHDPQGIHVVDSHSVIVAQKPELTLVQDTDNDGIADLYSTLNDDWRYIGDYCEYVHGPVVDSEGNYYININLANGPNDMTLKHGVAMGTGGGYDGWNCKITPDGDFIPYASGLRSPAGLGINKKNDEIWYTDNQGEWVGSSFLTLIEEGGFYGYPSSLIDHPEFRGQPEKIVKENFEHMRKLPAVWLPHFELANSPGNPEFDYTEGKFGPFEGQIFIGCQARSNIARAAVEKVKGQYQGAVFNFVDHLQSGAIRLTFDSEGQLWVGQTGRGWASQGGELYGLQRVRWDGKTIPFEMKTINLTEDGFRISFTRPVSKESVKVGKIEVNTWRYNYSASYGSPKVDEEQRPIEAITISEDGLEVTFKTALETEKVYMIKAIGFTGEDDSPLSTNIGYYTLNNTL